ncbi:protein GrpE [Bacteroidia bacterium]|nr:protein GrpE [Bacteroidia bacterium]
MNKKKYEESTNETAENTANTANTANTSELNAENIDVENEDSADNSKDIESEECVEGDDLNEKYAELNDKYLRLYSDFDNYKKRTVKERFDLLNTASEGVITAMLSVVDDIERALPNISNEVDKQGIELVYHKMLSTMKGFGLELIETIGNEFDSEISEAIAQIPVEDTKEKGIVKDEIQKGYKLKGKVIRHSKVVVGV